MAVAARISISQWGPGNGENARRVPLRGQERHEIAGRDRGGHGVVERMEAERFVRHQRLVEDDADAALPVVDDREWRDRAWFHAEMGHQRFGLAEGKALAAKDKMQGLEIDRGLLVGDEKYHRALFVLEEQVLGVPARNFAPMPARLLDAEDARVSDRAVRDFQVVERREKIVRRGRPSIAMSWRVQLVHAEYPAVSRFGLDN